jgi:hypothetical protein
MKNQVTSLAASSGSPAAGLNPLMRINYTGQTENIAQKNGRGKHGQILTGLHKLPYNLVPPSFN